MKYKNLTVKDAPRPRAFAGIQPGCGHVVRLLALAALYLPPLPSHSPEEERAEILRLFPPIPNVPRVAVGDPAAARLIAAELRAADISARADGGAVAFNDPRQEYVCELIFEELNKWKQRL